MPFRLLIFYAKHVAVLLAVVFAAAGAGSLVARERSMAMRCAIGLALWGEVLLLLAMRGWVGAGVFGAVAILFARPGRAGWKPALLLAPLFFVALQPPGAFDETLYHLPFVRAIAQSGALAFRPELRFPAFPQLHELLCAPVFLFAGDTATHLVALVELAVTVAIVAEWARRYAPRAEWLAAALLISNPIVLHLGTITYVDAALLLFVTAGFCLLGDERRSSVLFSAVLFGAACSVKYLGGFFAIAALAIVVIVRRRDALPFACVTAAAALPTTLWLIATTGNPLYPWMSSLFGANEYTLPPAPRSGLVELLRVPWDAVFARERMNAGPPVTPLIFLLLALVGVAAFRERKSQIVVVMSLAYLAVFAFLPRDTRYLVPLLPLFCVAGAVIIERRFPKLTMPATLIAAAIGVAYIAWRLHVVGLPPTNERAREAMLVARIDGYAALQRAGVARVYVCGGEQLQYFARGSLVGDFAGPNRYQRVLEGDPSTLPRRLRETGAEYLLVVKQTCGMQPSGLALEYDDGRAQLWRVQR